MGAKRPCPPTVVRVTAPLSVADKHWPAGLGRRASTFAKSSLAALAATPQLLADGSSNLRRIEAVWLEESVGTVCGLRQCRPGGDDLYPACFCPMRPLIAISAPTMRRRPARLPDCLGPRPAAAPLWEAKCTAMSLVQQKRSGRLNRTSPSGLANPQRRPRALNFRLTPDRTDRDCPVPAVRSFQGFF